jgi:50S ribosomal protein L16 3-hydroxylase
LKILDTFPNAEEFYRDYWGRAPFVVRGGVPEGVIEGCIDGDSLAGLSMEEDVKSRLVITAPEGGKWACEHGPFEEERFGSLSETHWSLLVQNVEQYHVETAEILSSFGFAPRWLMDDVMVSYSEAGGSVGPHIDSYHVFLVQGQGRRTWRVSDAPIVDPVYVDGLDLQVLRDGFAGDAVEVTCGDVLYIPPAFGHEGTTSEAAMTFSVGFLGPKMSEMLVEYGHHLEQSGGDTRYSGAGLDASSAGAVMSGAVAAGVQADLVSALSADSFARWMAQYFSQATHMDDEDIDGREDVMNAQDLDAALLTGGVLRLPAEVKIVISATDTDGYVVAVYGEAYGVDGALAQLLQHKAAVSDDDLMAVADRARALDVLAALYNRDVLVLD